MKSNIFTKLAVATAMVAASLSAATYAQTSKEVDCEKTIPAKQHTIEIHKFKFSQPELDVKVGDEVTWINMDIVPHTATALDKSWDSGRLKKGESFTLKITDKTSLDYFCLYHRQMKAKLIQSSSTD